MTELFVPPASAEEYAWTADCTSVSEMGRLTSEDFMLCGCKWRSFCYPKGNPASRGHNSHLSLYLEAVPGSGTPRRASFQLSVLGEHAVTSNKGTEEKHIFGDRHKSNDWGFGEFLPLTDIANPAKGYVVNGKFRLAVHIWDCEVWNSQENAYVSLNALPSSTFVSDMSVLLESGDGADVTLMCGRESIKAHSIILCARSPVFRAQLKGNLACSLDAVPVPEEIDAPTLRHTLAYIYTDECNLTSAEQAQHLLNAADHYNLLYLFSMCEHKLIDALSVENAAYALTLAEQHNARALKEASLRFVAQNAVAVVSTDGWAHLVRVTPALAGQALVALATM